MRAIRRKILFLIAAVAIPFACDLTDVHAQIAPRPIFAQAQPKSGGVTVIESKTYVVEAIVVAGLFGAAIFAVCRSSRRG